MSRKSTNPKLSILGQVCNLIPAYLVPKLARECDAAKKSRSFSPWSHVVALLYAQLAHSLSLNDVCDGLKNHAGRLLRIRGATVPSRNAFSHANRERDGSMAEKLFYELLDHFMTICPRFGGPSFKKLPRRFKRTINAMDCSTIQLVANCIDWARHRRRKAAAKLHLRLNLQCFLPTFAVVSAGSHNENRHARQLCAGLQAGEIVIFDKGYLDLEFLHELTQRGIFWVTRAKDNLQYRVAKRLLKKRDGNILRDDKITLTGPLSSHKYSTPMRLVRAIVEVDGQPREMVFLTNNFEWAPSSIAELYKCRWQIEVFFKEIKQTLHLCDFLGHNQNAVLWQVWTALIVYLLLRFAAFANGWHQGFRRFFCLLRSCLWERKAILRLIEICGTAGGSQAWRAAPHQLYLPGFQPSTNHG